MQWFSSGALEYVWEPPKTVAKTKKPKETKASKPKLAKTNGNNQNNQKKQSVRENEFMSGTWLCTRGFGFFGSPYKQAL